MNQSGIAMKLTIAGYKSCVCSYICECHPVVLGMSSRFLVDHTRIADRSITRA